MLGDDPGDENTVVAPPRGPAVVLLGWREGTRKVRAIQLLRRNGVPLSVAYDAITSVLNGQPVTVRLREGVDADEIRHRLGTLLGIVT